MSTAHVCLRSALIQAFCPPRRGTAAAHTVASFLVPRLNRPVKRSFSATRRSKRTHPAKESVLATENCDTLYESPRKPVNKWPISCIPLPPRNERHQIETWLAAIEPFLPVPLRAESHLPDRSSSVKAIDLALVLNAAQSSNLDILSHLGLEQGRWATVVWIAKKVLEDGKQSVETLTQLNSITNNQLFKGEKHSLDRLTENSLVLSLSRPTTKINPLLDDLTSAPEKLDPKYMIMNRALGQLWRSLGNMILAASANDAFNHNIMPHVLEIIAQLHHVGLMPDSVYTYRSLPHKYALQQPPTLHMLSSKILSALSDATWKAHEASVRLAKKDSKASYFLGHEIPGSRYRVTVSELAPELWLELVLWACLHGDWTQDGVAILQTMANMKENQSWGLISWREVLQAEEDNSPAPSRAWKLFSTRKEPAASAEDRARTRKTLSSEVVAAFVDALLSDMRLAVGERGIEPELLLKQIKTLKGMLDANNLSLGYAAWDSITARLLESGGLDPEKKPNLLLQIFELTAGFGDEVSTANTYPTPDVEVPYFFEPTALPLNALHRAMRAFVANGDLKDAMATFRALQKYTDDNKQKSLREFFETLKATAPLLKDEPFTSVLPPVHFPAFDTQLPIPLRVKLLDLATDLKEFDLARWFLFAEDLDGPLIGRELHDHRNVAASIVRFGTLASENDLVLRVIKKVSTWNEKHQQQRMPAEILIALLCSQIRLHRWESVRSMRRYVTDVATFRPKSVILAIFAAELLRIKMSEGDVLKAKEAFAGLLFAWERLILSNVRNELYCILSIMSSVDEGWREYCSQFLAQSLHQEVKLPTSEFNQILDAVLDAYGSLKGKVMVQTWCYGTPKSFESYRAPGGLPSMPWFLRGKAKEFGDRPKHIEIVQDSGAKQILRGRIHPNQQTIWAVLRKAEQELRQSGNKREETVSDIAELRDTVTWAVNILYYLGYDSEDVVRSLDSSLVRIAGLERGPSDNGTRPDAADSRF